jgi:hypothetical protein
VISKRGITFPREMGPFHARDAISCHGLERRAPADGLGRTVAGSYWQVAANALVKKLCTLFHLIQVVFYVIIANICMHINNASFIFWYQKCLTDFLSPLLGLSNRLGLETDRIRSGFCSQAG